MKAKLTARTQKIVTPILRQLITWENEIAINSGYCAACRPNDLGQAQGQFSMNPVHVINPDGSWDKTYAENTLGTPLTLEQLVKISKLQVPDNFSVDMKMTWATWGCRGTWGGIMKADGGEWTTATNIKMIASVYAGQWVEIIDHRSIWTNFNGLNKEVPMSRIKTYQPHEWHLPLATQKVTAVTADNNHYETPKGIFRMPIYFGARQAWVMDDWLEK